MKMKTSSKLKCLVASEMEISNNMEIDYGLIESLFLPFLAFSQPKDFVFFGPNAAKIVYSQFYSWNLMI